MSSVSVKDGLYLLHYGLGLAKQRVVALTSSRVVRRY